MSFHPRPKKIILGILLFTVVVIVGWFGWEFIHYVRAIRSGAINPILEQNLQSSFSQSVANEHVTADDIARLSSADAPTLGKAGSKLTIIEFADFDCPYCGQAFVPVRDAIEKYKDRIYFVARDFPIEELHPRALRAALAARCAQAQGKYWPYHDRLFIAQAQREDADFIRFAQNIGLDVNAFSTCYTSDQFKEKISRDVRVGLQAGVQGTPTFFFNGVKVQGAVDAKTLDFLIQRFLKL